MFRACAVLAAALLLLALPPATPWAAEEHAPHHADLAIAAARLLPAHERALVMQHEEAFRRGANEPDLVTNPVDHRYDPGDPSWGNAPTAARHAHDKAVEALRDGNAEQAAYWLGFMTHFVLDVAQPMHSGGGWDAIANEWHADYEDAAFAHASEVDLPTRHTVSAERAPEDVVVETAKEAGALWATLRAGLDATRGEPWSDEVARLTAQALAIGIPAAAEAMHGAFVAADFAATSAPPAVDPELRRGLADQANAQRGDANGASDAAAPSDAASEPPAPLPAGKSPPATALAIVGIAAVLLLGLALASRRAPQGSRGRGEQDRT